MQATISKQIFAPGDWRQWFTLVFPVLAVGMFLAGLAWRNPGLIGGGAVALCAIWRSTGKQVLGRFHHFAPAKNKPISQVSSSTLRAYGVGRANGEPPTEPHPPRKTPATRLSKHTGRGPSGASKLVESLIRQGRYALLLRPETVSQLADDEIAEVLAVMDEFMSVVPAGRVLVGEYAERATWGATPASADSAGLEDVGGCYLDRFAVTNAQYQHFVDAGGYEQFQFWPEEALPALFEFIDRTGKSAPAFWYDGHFLEGEDLLPVVGISWYEAAAYAHWAGKRLPTDAEWTKAGAWPVETSPGRVTQRRYPWGDTYEARRAVLWSSGKHGPQPVDACEQGASLGSVYQLIGNVWEWTSTALNSTGRDQAGDGDGLKVIHGGAFNTYFENQASCHFRSGERPLGRRANIGFRLALPFDVVADHSPETKEVAPERTAPNENISEVAPPSQIVTEPQQTTPEESPLSQTAPEEIPLSQMVTQRIAPKRAGTEEDFFFSQPFAS